MRAQGMLIVEHLIEHCLEEPVELSRSHHQAELFQQQTSIDQSCKRVPDNIGNIGRTAHDKIQDGCNQHAEDEDNGKTHRRMKFDGW